MCPVHNCRSSGEPNFVSKLGAPLFTSSDIQVASVAREEARLTHWHAEAGEASAAMAVMLRSLLRGNGWHGALNAALAATSGQTKAVLQQVTGITSVDALSADGYAPNVIQAAVWFVHTGVDFADAVTRSIEFARISNYCPVLVGPLAAARWGFQAVATCPIEHDLADAASHLFEYLWMQPNKTSSDLMLI